MTFALVCLLGGVGSATRFTVDGLIRSRRSRAFPLATFSINITGALIIGLLAGGLAAGTLGSTAYALAAGGFCGGFTTFSTSMVENVRLLQERDYRRVTVYAGGTLVLAVSAAALGVGIMTWLT